MLAARICQLYPNSLPSTLVTRFFRIYTQWKWPAPVLLTNIEEGGPLARKVWNPRTSHKDRMHLMPIITPAYPSMNSTYNVSESTKRILLKEFKRGSDITFSIESQTKTWEDLFEQFQFWEKYKFYLRIDCLAKTEQEHRKWVGFVESRIRFIILKLENTLGVKYVHPHPETIKFNDEKFPFASAFFLGLRFDVKRTKANGAKVDLTPAVIDFRRNINDWRDKSQGMEINVNWIKRAQLPDFVFGDQPRPPPQKKRKKKKENATGGPHKKAKTDTATTTTTTELSEITIDSLSTRFSPTPTSTPVPSAPSTPSVTPITTPASSQAATPTTTPSTTPPSSADKTKKRSTVNAIPMSLSRARANKNAIPLKKPVPTKEGTTTTTTTTKPKVNSGQMAPFPVKKIPKVPSTHISAAEEKQILETLSAPVPEPGNIEDHMTPSTPPSGMVVRAPLFETITTSAQAMVDVPSKKRGSSAPLEDERPAKIPKWVTDGSGRNKGQGPGSGGKMGDTENGSNIPKNPVISLLT